MANTAQKLLCALRPRVPQAAYGYAMPIGLTAVAVFCACEEFLTGGNAGRSVPISGGGPPD